MQAIFRLIKDPAGRSLHHTRTDLLSTMGRQAVQHDGAGVRFGQQLLIHTEPLESLFPLPLLLLLANSGPNIGVDRLRTCHCGTRIAGDTDFSTAHCECTGLVKHTGQRLKSIGAGDAHIHA